MNMQVDILGYEYDADEAPSFLDCGLFWWHRPTKRLLTKASITAYMNSFTPKKAMGAKESGDPSQDWVNKNVGRPTANIAPPPVQPKPPIQAPTITQPTGMPITGDTGGTKTVVIDLDARGATLAANKTATVTYNDGAAKTAVAALTAGMTGHEMAMAIATALNAEANLGAAATGSTVTVTPTDTTVLASMTLAIA